MATPWRWSLILGSLVCRCFTEEDKGELMLKDGWKCVRWTNELRRKSQAERSRTTKLSYSVVKLRALTTLQWLEFRPHWRVI